jgi:uncharacterized protein DUF5753
MSAQLGQLAVSAGDIPQVTVQVLPFSSGATAASGSGPLVVLELAGNPSLGLVCLRSMAGGVYLEDPSAVTRHDSLFRHVRAAAPPPGESARLIRDAAEENRPG